MNAPLNDDYGHGGALLWSKWLGHLAGKPNVRALEVGSYLGQSTTWFLRNILNGKGSHIVCVDTWKAGESMAPVEDNSLLEGFRTNTAKWEKQVVTRTGTSEYMLHGLAFSLFDFAFIDGSHTAKSVLADSVNVWRLVKPSGIIMWDDYKWYGMNNPLLEPKLAKATTG